MAENRDSSVELRDGETVRLLRQRRPEGLRQVLANYGPKVRWYLRREFGRSLNEIEIDEVINLAAHKVWRSSATYDENKGTLRAWFYVISRNCALTVLRRESRERAHAEVEDWDRTTLLAVQPSKNRPTTLHSKFINDLRDCIGKLAPLQMSIIKADLCSGDVADAGELAKTHSTTKNSIYASRSIARKTLKRELIKLGHSPGDQPTGSQ